MKYLAAYALLTLSGKKDIKAEDLKKVLGEVQASISEEQLNGVIAALKGKNIQQIITEGSKKLGGGSTAPSAPKKQDKPAANKKEQTKPAKEAAKPAAKPAEKPAEKPADDDGQEFFGGGLFD